ncbi:MAG: serine/threonine protein kinase [Hyalangium sp.]|uniref:serine/threonine protein kinase n=1 Tax=Hyalangium sp. TaxID=2028555 RepID=UPI00389AA367
MEFPHAPDLHPAFLLPGMPVGPWRVVSRRGRGTYGVIYRAVKDGGEPEGLVALKIAVMEWDERCERELELLSRIHHPSVPRPRGHGLWRSPGGRVYPYIVMEWVEGVPLYEWGTTRNPSSRQVLRLLAQVAGALAATHAAGGVHRDVKGDNLLVKKDGERAVLTDFGAGHHTGAERMAPFALPPGTPAYRSPEAWLFAHRHGRQPKAHGTAQPADDLFALGVTAYRWVTERYPPPTEPSMEGSEVWHVEGEELESPRELNPRVAPQLDALILRMLSVDPKVRGTAREMAEALEQAAERAGPEASAPLFGRDMEKLHAEVPREIGEGIRLDRLMLEEQRRALARTQQLTPQSTPAPPEHKRWLGLTLAIIAVVMPLALKSPRFESGAWEPIDPPQLAREEMFEEGRGDVGTVDLGGGVLTSSETVGPLMSDRGQYGSELPQTPLPGQQRPPCPGELEIQGGCWMKQDARPPDCPDIAYEWRGGCYVPVLSKPRGPTSDE